MNTTHRETVIEFLDVAVEADTDDAARTSLSFAAVHALLAIRDLLAERLPQVGPPNLADVLAARGVAEEFGVDLDEGDGFDLSTVDRLRESDGRTVWFRVLRDDTLDDAEREDWAGLLGHYGPLREATPADLARVGLGGRLRALADAPDPLEAPGTALGRAYRPYVTSGTVPTLNGAVAACHVCRGETGTPCHPDPTKGDQA